MFAALLRLTEVDGASGSHSDPTADADAEARGAYAEAERPTLASHLPRAHLGTSAFSVI